MFLFLCHIQNLFCKTYMYFDYLYIHNNFLNNNKIYYLNLNIILEVHNHNNNYLSLPLDTYHLYKISNNDNLGYLLLYKLYIYQSNQIIFF